MPDILVLGINGSERKHGNGAKLLQKTLYHARKEGAKTQIAHLIDYDQSDHYPTKYTARTPRGVERLFSLISVADGLVLSTPTRWYNVNALMKKFIEQLTAFDIRDYALRGKVAVFIATCEEDGAQQAINAMAGPLNGMGFAIPPQCMLFHNINMARNSEDQWQIKDTEILGRNIVRMIRCIRNQYWDYGSPPKKGGSR